MDDELTRQNVLGRVRAAAEIRAERAERARRRTRRVLVAALAAVALAAAAAAAAGYGLIDALGLEAYLG